MRVSTSLLFSSAISRMHRGDLMRPANTAGLWPKVEKQCYLLCLFAAEGSYLLSQSHLMIRCQAYLSKLTKKTLMTSRPLHTSKDQCQWKIIFRFQRSRNFHKELTCFKEITGLMSLCLHPQYPLLCLREYLKITCRFLVWQIITL